VKPHWAVVLTILLGGCVSTKTVVQNRFSTERGCLKDRVRVDDPEGTLYRVRGCDEETTYVCGAVAALKGGVECVERGLPNPPAYQERARPVMPPPDPNIPP
jgi:hypothetical protein